LSSILISFAVTLVVFTFVLCIGVVFKVTDLLARGVSFEPILRILLSGIPAALAFSIPVSILTSCLLVFGHLSADGEITAMKACGISMWQIVSVPRLLGLGLVIICIYINNELAPRSHYLRRVEVARLGVESPLELLEEGCFIQDFAGITIYIGRKSGNRLRNIIIYDLRNPKVSRQVRAVSGIVQKGENTKDLTLELYDVKVDPFLDDRPGALFCKKWPVVIKDALRTRTYRKKEDDMTLRELIDGILNVESRFPNLEEEDLARERMILMVQLNKRLVLSVSCYAFVLLGIPLGIKAHRKESSIGVAISLFLVFVFFLFIIVAESLAERPELRPDLISWLPVFISVTLGALLIARSN
jgi:lipopolysaccharide export system permease protein